MLLHAISLLFLAGSVLTLFAQSPRGASPAFESYGARVLSVTGQVNRVVDGQAWALSAGDRIPIQQLITTGRDGYAHFEVFGGSSFDIFSNSRVLFRQNVANTGDLLDILAGRVLVHFQPGIGQLAERIMCPVASITARQPATIALAMDEDDNVRIDVIEGAIRVQHALLPESDPLVVTAVDAILVRKDQRISRQLDRGSLYRYTVKPLKQVLSAITFGHSGHSEPEQKFLVQNLQSPLAQSPGR